MNLASVNEPHVRLTGTLPLWTVQLHMYVFKNFGTFGIVEWSLDHSWDWLVYVGVGDGGVRFAG